MDILTNFLRQIGFTVGILVIFGGLIALCRRAIYSIGGRAGYRMLIAVGVVGTPIHELSHAVMCLLFGHRITEIKFFDPGMRDGSLGYVAHTWNKRNLWHRIGNFFIGVAPILCGTGVLVLLMRLLVPDVFAGVTAEFGSIDASMAAGTSGMRIFWNTLWNLVCLIFDSAYVQNPRWWIFLVLALMIASHMELSAPDIRGGIGGCLLMALLLLIADAVMYWISLPALHAVTAAMTSFAVYIAAFLSIALIFCVAMVLLTLAVRCVTMLFLRR